MTTYLGGISAEDLDLLANTIGNNLAVLVVNNTNITIGCSVTSTDKGTSQSGEVNFDSDPYSIKALTYSGTYVNITVDVERSVTANVFASIYNAMSGSYVQLVKSGITTDVIQIGNSSFALQGGVMLICFNGV